MPYRLPTESAWEYAARAGTSTQFAFGEQITAAQANYAANRPSDLGPPGESRGGTVEVGSLPANGFGLHEVHGNVWEWTADCYVGSYVGAPTDGSARDAPNCRRRVLRGGSWFSVAAKLRSAYREWEAPNSRAALAGFRVATTPR